jgi:phosphatidylethanolamine-binding protein (PEBP) family uncharacterized protein
MNRHRLALLSALGALALDGLAGCTQNVDRPTPVPVDNGGGGMSGPLGGIPNIPGYAGAGGSGGAPTATGGSTPVNPGPDAATVDAAMASDGPAAAGDGPVAGDASSDGGGGTGALALTGDFTMMGTRLCFKDGQTKNTGTNQSPQLNWTGAAPAGTMSWALSLYDTTGKTTHWVIWDLPLDTNMLPAMLPKGVMPAAPAPTGSTQRGSSFAGGTTNPGYFGPGAGGAARRYEFQLWPLKVAKLQVAATVSVDTLHATTLPANAAGTGVILSVWGNQDANCN